jgi:hypothetical protein
MEGKQVSDYREQTTDDRGPNSDYRKQKPDLRCRISGNRQAVFIGRECQLLKARLPRLKNSGM